MSLQLPNRPVGFIDDRVPGQISVPWYLALLSIAGTVTGALVTSVNVAGNNGITVAGGPITTAGVITLGIGNLTCANALVAGTVTTAREIVSGTLTASDIVSLATVQAANVSATGTVTAVNVIVTGTVQSLNIAATGTVTAANIVDTGTLTAAAVQTVNLAATGTVTSAALINTGTISSAAVVATATVSAVNMLASGTITAANVISTQTVASVGLTATGRIEPTSTVGILGAITNDDAQAGSIGEYKSSTVLVAAQVSLATGTATDVTSLALSGGDWEVWGNVGLSTSGSTVVTNFGAWSSVTSASLPTLGNSGGESFFNLTYATGTSSIIPAGRKRFPLTGTATVVLSTYVAFASGGAAAYGFLGARRMR